MGTPELEGLNRREFRKLVLSAKASGRQLELLLAVCDDRTLQDAVISAYEAELEEAGYETYRVRLNTQQPSLRDCLEQLVARQLELRGGKPSGSDGDERGRAAGGAAEYGAL